MDIVHCNKQQADKIIDKFFQKRFIITNVSKDYEDGIYFITARHGLSTTSQWQWRGYPCFGEVYYKNKRYDIYEHSHYVLDKFNEACEKAIKDYENGSDIFNSDTKCIYIPNNVVFIFILAILLILFAICFYYEYFT